MCSLSEIKRIIEQVALSYKLDGKILWDSSIIKKQQCIFWANLLINLYKDPFYYGSASSSLFVSKLSWSLVFRHKGSFIPICSKPYCGRKAEISLANNHECPSCFNTLSKTGISLNLNHSLFSTLTTFCNYHLTHRFHGVLPHL